MGKVLARGHSRVPVYAGNPRNIIGLLLVTFDPKNFHEVPSLNLLLFHHV